MMFAAFLGSAGGIKIAEDSVLKSSVGLVIGENALENQLGFSIGINGRLRVILRNRNGFRLAVGRGGRGENKMSNAVARHGVQKIDAAGDVGRIKDARLFHRLGHQRFGREVHHRVNLVLLEHSFDLLAVSQIHVAKHRAWRNRSSVSFQQAIQRNYVHSAREQNLRANASDVACRSGDQDVQGTLLPPIH